MILSEPARRRCGWLLGICNVHRDDQNQESGDDSEHEISPKLVLLSHPCGADRVYELCRDRSDQSHSLTAGREDFRHSCPRVAQLRRGIGRQAGSGRPNQRNLMLRTLARPDDWAKCWSSASSMNSGIRQRHDGAVMVNYFEVLSLCAESHPKIPCSNCDSLESVGIDGMPALHSRGCDNTLGRESPWLSLSAESLISSFQLFSAARLYCAIVLSAGSELLVQPCEPIWRLGLNCNAAFCRRQCRHGSGNPIFLRWFPFRDREQVRGN
jgi:hypothetical protein